jgi:fermentation-respiration switch protein FrsA (DUF1100 family)
MVSTENSERRKKRRRWLRRLWIYPLIYIAICGVVFLFQRRIQYPGDSHAVLLPAAAARDGVREVELTTEDGLRLFAWYRPGRRAGTIVLFHGNGGNRGDRLEWIDLLNAQGAGVFLVDYRGYGGSEGSPSEEGLYLDAEASIAWVRENAPGPIVLMGESLGTGVAVEMASRHDVAGLILHASFISTVDVVRKSLFFLPVGLLMLDRYDSGKKLGAVPCPKLFFHGREDTVVPYRSGQALYVAAADPKRWVEILGAGHMDLHVRDVPRYYGAIREFLDEVLTEN